MSIYIPPLSTPELWIPPENIATTTNFTKKVVQLEQEALEKLNNLPEAKHAQFRAKVNMEIIQILTLIYEMRSEGQSEYAINRVFEGLSQDFHRSISTFIENNKQFSLNREQVSACNRSIENTLRHCTTKLKPLKYIPPDDDAICKRPSFSKAQVDYAGVAGLDGLQEVAGGRLKQKFDIEIFTNSYAARISYVLLQAGIKIPAIPGQTVSGENGEQYIYRLTTLEKFMRETFGPPDCEWIKHSVIPDKCTDLDGRRGILISRCGSGSHTSCTENAQLTDGNWSWPPYDGVFWELPDDEDETILTPQD